MEIQSFTTTDGEVIAVSRLVTLAYYARRYVRADGKIGCHQSYIKSLMIQGKLPCISVAGKDFVVLPAKEPENARNVNETRDASKP